MLVGLISDTHVPYRADRLPHAVLDALRDVDLILHAGDVDEPWVLDRLRELAPVHAVRGNYHFFDGSSGGASLPASLELDIAGARVALTHGHKIGPLTWFWKVFMVFQNLAGRWSLPAYDRAIALSLVRRFPNADIIVFGHTHRFYQAQWGRALLVNPGAALHTAYFNAPHTPTLAHLYLEPDRPPKVVRIQLDNLPD